ncbi:anthrone oxygenase family protein [Rhizobium sullae]|uniref:anthrone oxygenase family protein n=1 Tax=Rhizobium sullae TaxID=50338 RepID=UPI00313CF75E
MSACWFASATGVYLIFGLFLTLTVNVPMNKALSEIALPDDVETVRKIWRDYSQRWQFWNQARTAASGIALAFAGLGLAKL